MQFSKMPTTSNDIFRLTSKQNFVTIKENSGSNASFIIVELMKSFLTEPNDDLTVLVCCNQIYYHYLMLSKKFAFDLSRFSDDKFQYIELRNRNLAFDANVQKNLTDLFAPIQKQREKKLNIIVDDVSSWYEHLSLPLSSINNIFWSLKKPDNRIVALFHVCNNKTDKLASYFCHQSDLILETSALKTGYDRNISGLLETFEKEDFTLKTLKTLYHYKLTDRNVSLFSPGSAIFNLQIN